MQRKQSVASAGAVFPQASWLRSLKPRSECSHRERLDLRNIVFTVCLLGCDALYERGLISVRTGGNLCANKSCDHSGLRNVLNALAKRRCSTWAVSKASYFE